MLSTWVKFPTVNFVGKIVILLQNLLNMIKNVLHLQENQDGVRSCFGFVNELSASLINDVNPVI